MKPVIDAFSGNTLTVAIDAPYEMDAEIGKSGFQLRSQAKSGIRASVLARPKRVHARLSISECGMETKMAGSQREDGQSDSVRGLREDFIVVREDVEVHFGAREGVLGDGSDRIWDGGHHEYHFQTMANQVHV